MGHCATTMHSCLSRRTRRCVRPTKCRVPKRRSNDDGKRQQIRSALLWQFCSNSNCRAVLEEATEVGRADGAQLADDEAARILATLLTYPADAGTSMYFDRLAGRPLEVETLTGAVVACGERLGIPTPLNRMLLALLQAISDAT